MLKYAKTTLCPILSKVVTRAVTYRGKWLRLKHDDINDHDLRRSIGSKSETYGDILVANEKSNDDCYFIVKSIGAERKVNINRHSAYNEHSAFNEHSAYNECSEHPERISSFQSLSRASRAHLKLPELIPSLQSSSPLLYDRPHIARKLVLLPAMDSLCSPSIATYPPTTASFSLVHAP
jgi:hypothetical protein